MSVNTAEFFRQFDRSIADTEEQYYDALRLVALKLFKGIVLKTPVDTGRARMNWQIAFNSIPSGTIDAEPDEGSSARAPAESAGSRRSYASAVSMVNSNRGEFDYIAISNNLPYISRLEYLGWSQQSPAGMVRVTLTEFDRIVREAAREVGR